MLFYLLLSFLIGPAIGYYLMGKTVNSTANGWVAGSALSIAMWYMVGKKMV
jgi:hypothetical protein